MTNGARLGTLRISGALLVALGLLYLAATPTIARFLAPAAFWPAGGC
jgi:hypothetical protein